MPYTDNPSGNPLDAVRFLVGDTGTTSELTDPEIAFLLEQEDSNTYRAAARAAETLGARYSKSVDKQVGNLRLSSSQKADAYRKLALSLWEQATRGTFIPGSLVAPWAGGISRNDKINRARNPDRVRPSFARRMMRYPFGDAAASGESDVSLQEQP